MFRPAIIWLLGLLLTLVFVVPSLANVPVSWEIVPASRIGYIRLGWNMASAHTALAAQARSFDGFVVDEDRAGFCAVYRGGNERALCAWDNFAYFVPGKCSTAYCNPFVTVTTPGRVAMPIAFSPRYRTADGLGPSSTLERWRERYGPGSTVCIYGFCMTDWPKAGIGAAWQFISGFGVTALSVWVFEPY